MLLKKNTQLNQKVLLLIVTVIWLVFSAVTPGMPALHARAEGKACGDGVYYTLQGGTLTVYGEGEMSHFQDTPAPWSDAKEKINTVVIEEGVTSIGSMAFMDCKRLASVKMADSVKSISTFAFKGCTALTSVKFSSNLKYIYESAFEECSKLLSVRLPDGLYRVSDRVFYRCYALSAITIPKSVGYFGKFVFSYCSELLYANILCDISLLPAGTFSDCKNLTTISLPETVTETGEDSLAGCVNLTTVCYPASEEAADNLAAEIGRDVEGFSVENISTETVNDEQPVIDSLESWQTEQTDENVVTITVTTVKETESSFVQKTEVTTYTTDVSGNLDEKLSSSVTINAKVEQNEGWADVEETIKESEASIGGGTQAAQVSVVIETEKESVPGSTLTTLAGNNANLQVSGTNGTAVNIDCTRLKEKDLDDKKDYAFTYTVEQNGKPSAAQSEVIGSDTKNFTVKFEEPQKLDQSPAIYVGEDEALSLATLYSQNGKELNKMQTVVVDKEGYANFYVSSTTKDTSYVVAVNAKGENRKDAIIPPSLYENYGIDPAQLDMPYVPTQMRLLNGFNVYQVVFGVVGGVIGLGAIVGAVFFVFYRKRRLELLYAMKSGNRDVIEKFLGPDDDEIEAESRTQNPVQKDTKSSSVQKSEQKTKKPKKK